LLLFEGSELVIDVLILYMFGLLASVTFLVTRKFLRARQDNETTRADRWLYSLGLVSLTGMTLAALFVFMIELLFVLTIPVQGWSHTIEFLNDLFPVSSAIFVVLPLALSIVLYIVMGYYMPMPRGEYNTVTTMRNRWLWALLVLYVVVGMVGILTGFLL
jgi:hypothetical protein